MSLVVVILTAGGISLFSNRNIPTHSQVVDHLDPQEKSGLAEALHLKQTLGESLWPGWGRAEIPIFAWNERYGFLVGEFNPPPDWEEVPGDDFLGKPYYRIQPPKREAFVVLIGEHWASSIGTVDWMQISFVNELRGNR